MGVISTMKGLFRKGKYNVEKAALKTQDKLQDAQNGDPNLETKLKRQVRNVGHQVKHKANNILNTVTETVQNVAEDIGIKKKKSTWQKIVEWFEKNIIEPIKNMFSSSDENEFTSPKENKPHKKTNDKTKEDRQQKYTQIREKYNIPKSKSDSDLSKARKGDDGSNNKSGHGRSNSAPELAARTEDRVRDKSGESNGITQRLKKVAQTFASSSETDANKHGESSNTKFTERVKNITTSNHSRGH